MVALVGLVVGAAVVGDEVLYVQSWKPGDESSVGVLVLARRWLPAVGR